MNIDTMEIIANCACLECYSDPNHAVIHDFFVIGIGLMKWLVEQDSLHYEPTSPMYSEESLKDYICLTLPAILADPPRDVIFQSPSGTGKTIALLIAMLNRIDENKNCTQILCLAPTLLAAQQLSRDVARYLSLAKLYAILTGGEIESNDNIKGKNVAAHVAVGTAESMLDWLNNSSIDLVNIHTLMIDDADYLMKSEECWNDCKKLVKLLPSTSQLVFCSTTFNPSSIEVASDIMKTPHIAILSPTSQCLKDVKQYYIQSTSKEDKCHAIGQIYNCLSRLHRRNKYNGLICDKVIVFCNERETAKWLYELMETDDRYKTAGNPQYLKVCLVTEDVKYETDQDHRLTSMQCGLKYTNLLDPYSELKAFGHHCFTNMCHSNFDLPVNQCGEADFETYLHRISRTGRFDKEATAINLVDSEQSLRVCRAIEEYFGKEIHPLDVNDDANELELKICSSESSRNY